MVLLRNWLFDGLELAGVVPMVGEDMVGRRECSAGVVQDERFALLPRPDDDEPLDEFKFGDVGERLIKLLIEFESREIVSTLSGIGRNIWASGLNGRIERSTSTREKKKILLID